MFGQFIPDIFLSSPAGWNDHEHHDELDGDCFFLTACCFSMPFSISMSVDLDRSIYTCFPADDVTLRDVATTTTTTAVTGDLWLWIPALFHMQKALVDVLIPAVPDDRKCCCNHAYIVALSWQCLHAYQNVPVDKQRVIIAVTNTTSFTLPRANMTLENCNNLSW